MRLSLKYLILGVAMLSLVLTLVSSITSGYRVQKQSLIDNTLETNRAYAEKLSSTTESYLEMTLQTLEVSAKTLAPHMRKEEADSFLIPEADRVKNQTNTFNSIAIVEKGGEILATSPQTLELRGKMLTSKGGMQALEAQKPFISEPYIALTGRLIIFISHPVFDENNNYLGIIGGTIYLKEENILQEVLGEHFYQDGSYVYVVDKTGRIIYHQDKERINDFAPENPVIQDVIKGNSGAMRLTNSKEIDMLAGYAYLPNAEWGIVTQRSTEATLVPVNNMMKEMIVKALPFLFISILIIWYFSKQIALPLQKLATYAESSTESNQEKKISTIRTWYYEAIQLKKALHYSMNFFQDRVNFYLHQSTTDPLTKLWNRRAMDEFLKELTDQEKAYAVVILDIDRFKRVNDTYGHAVGDDVLKFLAKVMQDVTREQDRCCRFGGEEFVIVLPEATEEIAFQVAERLRKKMENTVSPCGEVVTVSLGIATSPHNGTHPKVILEAADESLYEAKRSGRNRTIISQNHKNANA
ncbi:diguanylate cyclase [Sporosarcina saromensis]|uniref:Diguanylate cyclase n=1 Tax=Sporosarcina saromensis TaxID=359365 RepID=A0ABU4G856_9BACL|nr:diguanylate cyclase [Sporosarcina saromensis]MDW0113159.1 diguanylate cyclase [Sporosarcina saromensis]